MASDHGSWEPWSYLGLRDGRIFLTVGTRWPGQMGCSARVLDPEGEDIDTAPELIIIDDARSPDCGYPWSVELEDGRVLVTYWHHFENDLRGIEGAIVEEV